MYVFFLPLITELAHRSSCESRVQKTKNDRDAGLRESLIRYMRFLLKIIKYVGNLVTCSYS